MRRTVSTLCVLLLSPTVVLGKSLYVSCRREVPLRATTSVEGKTVTALKSGEEVTLIGEQGNYYLVSLADGTKGYVFKEYLTDQTPAETRLRELEARLREMEQKSQRQVKDLEAQTQAREQEILQLREERTRFEEERAQLEAAKKQAEAEANQQTQLAAQLQTQQDTFKRNSKLHWFLAGAGVLLIGWLLGWLWGEGRRQNRRNRLSLS